MKNSYRTTISQTLVISANEDETAALYGNKNSFITLEIVKLLPTPPNKEYRYGFESNRTAFRGGKDIDLFPQDGIIQSEVLWYEATDTWHWTTVQLAPPTMLLPDQIEHHIQDGWKPTRCFIEGQKATAKELIAHLIEITEPK